MIHHVHCVRESSLQDMKAAARRGSALRLSVQEAAALAASLAADSQVRVTLLSKHHAYMPACVYVCMRMSEGAPPGVPSAPGAAWQPRQ